MDDVVVEEIDSEIEDEIDVVVEEIDVEGGGEPVEPVVWSEGVDDVVVEEIDGESGGEPVVRTGRGRRGRRGDRWGER